MDQLYKALVQQLKNNVPELLWIDLEQGQLETPEDQYPVQFPCCLISFPNVPAWQSLGNGLQIGDALITFRIAFDIYEDTHKEAPDMEDALLKLQLINKIHKYLHHFEGEHFNKLERTGSSQEQRPDSLLVFNMQYNTNIRDAHAVPVYEQTQIHDLQLNLNTKIITFDTQQDL